MSDKGKGNEPPAPAQPSTAPPTTQPGTTPPPPNPNVDPPITEIRGEPVFDPKKIQ